MRLSITFLTLLTLLPTSEAATVFRCTTPSGQITFSQHGCSTDQTQSLQEATNPTPGSGKPVPMAKPERMTKRQTASRSERRQYNEVVVVAEQQDGCGNRVTGNERRKAIIDGRVKSGMTQADVESSLGKPDTISLQNGTTRFHYKADKRHGTRTVSFDEDGCVMGKKTR